MSNETEIISKNRSGQHSSMAISLTFFILAVVLFILGTWILPIESIIGVSVISALLFFFGMRFAGFFEDKVYFYNDKDAINLCAKVFNFAKEEICSVTGEGNSLFYENPKIKSAISRKSDKHVHIRILFGPYLDIKSINLFELARKKKITMRRMSKREMYHYKIIDEEYVDIADIHDPLVLERSGYVEHSASEALKYKERFEKLWEKAEEFDIIKELKKEIKELKKEDVEEESKGQNKERNFGFIKGVPGENGKIIPTPASIDEIKELKKQILEYCGGEGHDNA